MIVDRDLASNIRQAAQRFPVLTLTGPRQSGKSTLCRVIFPQHRYLSLEALDVRSFAQEDPRAFLAQFDAGAVIDEVHRAPDLLSYLQGLVDEDPTPGRWILTGSQNLALLETVSQSLAGRTAVQHLLPMARSEVLRFNAYPTSLDETLLTGGYPRILDYGLRPADWLGPYVTTYIERDVRSITNVGDLATFQRFVELCAGRTGQLLNFSSLADDCAISQPTAKNWLSILEASYIAFRLRPFHASMRRRLIKAPKLHFYDTGIVCWLLGIRTAEQLRSHPLRGAIFETWVVSEIVKHRMNRGVSRGCFFYRHSDGTEADLVIEHRSGLRLVEAKSGTTTSGSMFDGGRRTLRQLGAAAGESDLVVVYGGDQHQRRTAGRLVPWIDLHHGDWLH